MTEKKEGVKDIALNKDGLPAGESLSDQQLAEYKINRRKPQEPEVKPEPKAKK